MSIAVSKLVRYLKNKLDGDANLSNVSIFGELSNFHSHNSGHLYFTVKDEKAALSCVMFSSSARRLNFKPKNGDKVELTGSVSLFETTGAMQLYVSSMRLQGLGDLHAQYERLKAKLYEEGYFSAEHKKAKPNLYPNKVAVLCGDASAAMSDIKICFARRWPLSNVDYYPVLVQGMDAPENIINTLLKVDEMGYEYIILARGGGSFEDLFCFNDERLVKTIYSLKTFTVTGIGHEQDFTLSDFVADLRAATPTAAVELITPDIKKVEELLSEYKDSLNESVNYKLIAFRDLLDKLKSSKYLNEPLLLADKSRLKIDYYASRLKNIEHKFALISNNLDNNLKIMASVLDNKIKKKDVELKHLSELLKLYSVDNTLSRGYSLIYKEDKIIKEKTELAKGDEIKIRLYKGNVEAVIK